MKNKKILIPVAVALLATSLAMGGLFFAQTGTGGVTVTTAGAAASGATSDSWTEDAADPSWSPIEGAVGVFTGGGIAHIEVPTDPAGNWAITLFLDDPDELTSAYGYWNPKVQVRTLYPAKLVAGSTNTRNLVTEQTITGACSVSGTTLTCEGDSGTVHSLSTGSYTITTVHSGGTDTETVSVTAETDFTATLTTSDPTITSVNATSTIAIITDIEGVCSVSSNTMTCTSSHGLSAGTYKIITRYTYSKGSKSAENIETDSNESVSASTQFTVTLDSDKSTSRSLEEVTAVFTSSDDIDGVCSTSSTTMTCTSSHGLDTGSYTITTVHSGGTETDTVSVTASTQFTVTLGTANATLTSVTASSGTTTGTAAQSDFFDGTEITDASTGDITHILNLTKGSVTFVVKSSDGLCVNSSGVFQSSCSSGDNRAFEIGFSIPAGSSNSGTFFTNDASTSDDLSPEFSLDISQR